MPVDGHHPEEDEEQYPKPPSQRKKIVVVGLGMVGIAFMLVPLEQGRFHDWRGP